MNQVFILAYSGQGGFPYSSIMEMETKERLGYLKRLDEQIRTENAEIEKARAKARMRANSKRR